MQSVECKGVLSLFTKERTNRGQELGDMNLVLLGALI
jgi:hypothetical protein